MSKIIVTTKRELEDAVNSQANKIVVVGDLAEKLAGEFVESNNLVGKQQVAAALTGAEMLFFSFLALLFAGKVVTALRRDYNIKIKKKKSGAFELEFKKKQPN